MRFKRDRFMESVVPDRACESILQKCVNIKKRIQKQGGNHGIQCSN